MAKPKSRSRDGSDPTPGRRRQPPGVFFKTKKIAGGSIIIRVHTWRGTTRKQRKEIFANVA